MYKEIAQDQQIQHLTRQIEQGTETRKRYSVCHGKLWYKHRLVIPKTSKFIPVILAENHFSPVGGHSGVFKTLKRIQQSFHWEGIGQRVQKFVSECMICQTQKYSTLAPAGFFTAFTYSYSSLGRHFYGFCGRAAYF